MDPKQQTIDTYNASAQAMAKKFNDSGTRSEDVQRGLSFIEKKNPYVVEIGCGNGRDAAYILLHTNRYLGIDISNSMIDLAREKAPDGKFAVADLEMFNFPPEVDLIFAFASLLHSDPEHLKVVFSNAQKALNVGGVFYISLKYGSGEYVKVDEFGTRTFYYYTPQDIENLAGSGYETVWEDTQELRGQKWFTIALKKK